MQPSRHLLIALGAMWMFTARAQVGGGIGEGKMMLFGIVSEEKGGIELRNVTVRLYTDSVAKDSVFTDPMGKYQLFIPLAGVHRVVYSLDGFNRKIVEVDTNGELDEAARKQEWNLRVDIGLVRSDLVLPDELLDTPIGKAAWLPAVREFRWDQPYTERYKQRYKQAVKAAGRK